MPQDEQRVGGQTATHQTPSPLPYAPPQPLTLRINGAEHQLMVEPRVSLLDALREVLHLTGTKKGCDRGQCGACTVLVDGQRINSCLTLAVMHDGREITTVEGLGSEAQPHPMQQAFMDCDGFQCGYCTPGQVCSAVACWTRSSTPGQRRHRGRAAGAVVIERGRDPRAHERQPVPLRRLSEHRQGDPQRRAAPGLKKGIAYAIDLLRPCPRREPRDRAGARTRCEIHRRRHQPARPVQKRRRAAARLVDVSRLALNGIEQLPDGGLRIGAMASNTRSAPIRWCASATGCCPKPC
jgi:aerobic-type carbon monoxide dehydrogenase small subunit (CoxS/CutS family)